MMFLKFKRNNNLFPGDTLTITTPLPTVLNLASQCRGGTSPSFEKVTLMGPSVFDPPHTLPLEVGLSFSAKPSVQRGNPETLFFP